MPLKIVSVEPGSAAAEAGIAVHDEIVSVNGRPVRDAIDLRFHTADDRFSLQLKKSGPGREELWDLDLDLNGENLGVEVEDFRTKGCNNKCIFCFVDQLPAGSRKALLFKDDDFRLSFLHGNYITLTNLRTAEIERIVEQRLSPLYVSVHATNLEVRNRMLGRVGDGAFREKLERLVQGGIRLHTQVVLCPTYNDGPVLDETISDLFRYHPGVASVSIVPLGLSAHRRSLDGLVAVTPDFCRAVIEQVTPQQGELRRRSGVTFAYLADEFYLMASQPLPGTDYYDGFPLTEDGIGMVRRFSDDFGRNLRRVRPGRFSGVRGTIVTSLLFQAELRGHIERLNARSGSRLEVLAVENDFLGHNITVAGLLAGGDIAAKAKSHSVAARLIVPSEAVSNASKLFVDGLGMEEVSRLSGREVVESGLTVDAFFDLLKTLQDSGASSQECSSGGECSSTT